MHGYSKKCLNGTWGKRYVSRRLTTHNSQLTQTQKRLNKSNLDSLAHNFKQPIVAYFLLIVPYSTIIQGLYDSNLKFGSGKMSLFFLAILLYSLRSMSTAQASTQYLKQHSTNIKYTLITLTIRRTFLTLITRTMKI
jgi:hypothetical protein